MIFPGRGKEKKGESATLGVGAPNRSPMLEDKKREAMLNMVMSAPGNEKMFKELGISVKQEQSKLAQKPGRLEAYQNNDPDVQDFLLRQFGIATDRSVVPGKQGGVTGGPGAPAGASGPPGAGQVPDKDDAAHAALLQAVDAAASQVMEQMMRPSPAKGQSIAGHGGGVGQGQAAIGHPMDAVASMLHGLIGKDIGGAIDFPDPFKPKYPVRKTPFKQEMSKKAFQLIRFDFKGRAWTDDDFVPQYNDHVKRWCRPKDIGASDFQPVKPGSHWHLWRTTPSPKDVRQGILGDCWLLSALAALAAYRGGRLIKDMFPGQTRLCFEGVYLVRLCLAGRWCEILVDDRIPCVGGDPPYGTHPAYAHTVKQQIWVNAGGCNGKAVWRLHLWVSMVEKAMAKACGSYEALSGGQASEALTIFTGWPCSVIFVASPKSNASVVWADLVKAKKSGFMLTCTTGLERNHKECGLESQHVHVLLDLHEVTDRTGQKLRLFKIRNPQGEGADMVWNGAWSQDSNNWSTKLRDSLNYHIDVDEGVFFMSWEDFAFFFDHCCICRIRRGWQETRVGLRLPKDTPPQTGIAIEVSEAMDCVFLLQQAEKRLRHGPMYEGDFEPYACLGMAIIRDDEKAGQSPGIPKPLAVARMRHRENVTCECRLEPGRYFVVPLALTRSHNREVMMACHSDKAPALLKATGLEVAVVRKAWAGYAKYATGKEDEQGLTRSSCSGGELTIMQGDGACVIALAENTSGGHLQVDLEITSASMRYTRSPSERAHTCDYIPAAHAMIVQIAIPSKEETLAKWMASPEISPTILIPPPPHHMPALAKGQLGVFHAPFRFAEVDLQVEFDEKQKSRIQMMTMIKATGAEQQATFAVPVAVAKPFVDDGLPNEHVIMSSTAARPGEQLLLGVPPRVQPQASATIQSSTAMGNGVEAGLNLFGSCRCHSKLESDVPG